ncbi:MAG: ABC transporter ATP-binding protein, partial [Cyanobacteria bacterium P01_F01_bin.42]
MRASQPNLEKPWPLLRAYWFSRSWKRAWRLLIAVVVLIILRTALTVGFLIFSEGTISALASQDSDRFYQALFLLVAVIAIGVPLVSFSGFFREKLSLNWRDWLTHRFLDRYLQ